MKGILASTDNAIYNHLSFTRESVHDEMDLHKLGLLMQSLEANSRKNGYVKAAIEHYEEYGKMIGESYTPEEVYINAVGYNFLRDNKINDALNSFELAITYYPLSAVSYTHLTLPTICSV